MYVDELSEFVGAIRTDAHQPLLPRRRARTDFDAVVESAGAERRSRLARRPRWRADDRAACGCYPILAMPYDEAAIDCEPWREVEYSDAASTASHRLASEVPTLSEAERDLALRTVVEQVRGRIRVVMNTSAPGTDLAVLYSKRAENLGADALMVLPPPPATTSADETVAYYSDIAAATTLPIFLQDVPPRPSRLYAVHAARASTSGT
jgi:hypothetical protein